jgi:UDP-2-acetamido-3-amino-2,3-dideoxy-glucuronate N-acetyltransferase
MKELMTITPSVSVGKEVFISDSATIWDYVQIRDNAKIGKNVIIGRGAYIGAGVVVADNCKIQNYALLYEPATLEQGVFVGPSVVFTNDRYPRAVNPDLKLKNSNDWEPVGVHVKEGASIGARSVCVAPLIIGSWAMIAAGSVVTKNVVDFALMVGVPAKRVGWVGKVGQKLVQDDNEKSIFICPVTNSRYKQESQDLLVELSHEINL